MPEDTPTPPTPPVAASGYSTSERTEAKFFEEVDILIAGAKSLAAGYQPSNEAATIENLESRLAEALPLRAAWQNDKAAEETARNNRQNVFAPLEGIITDTVNFAESSGKPANDIAALKSIGREIKGSKPKAATAGNPNSISNSNQSYASLTDKYSMFIEQYEALGITTTDTQFQAATHRAKLAAMRAANTAVINAEAQTKTSQATHDDPVYKAADSLRNGARAAKEYLKSKRRTFPEVYNSVSKLRFELPKRLRVIVKE